MDITSLHYFRELTKDFNMTKTAARLYISPQTLSNHIQRLEQYYGTPLFSRKPALALTVAGEFVLSFAQEMEKENTKLRDILADIGQSGRGVMRFGATVSVADEDTDEEKRYQIVGDYEADIEKNKISLSSPLAKALIGKEVGDIAEYTAPGGRKSFEIIDIQYI